MSTSQAGLFEWKQEVNRRLAEHRSRKTSPAAGQRVVSASHRDSGQNRGAEAAARVAQRFAHAPRYLDMLVDDARERRTAETRSAAVVTEEVPQPMPARFESGVELAPECVPANQSDMPAAAVPAGSTSTAIPEWQTPEIRPEVRADARLFGDSAGELREQHATEWDPSGAAEEMQAADDDWMHGNLIEFPRELVATRKIRPRLVEGPLAATRGAQLSIFEVEPGTVSTVAEAADAQAADWNAPEWSRIELQAQREAETAQPAAPEVVAFPADTELAPWSRRLLALTVDAALICAAVLVAGAAVAANASSLPGPKAMGVLGVAAVVAATLLYDLLFFSLAQATPGMRYACIGLWTFRNERPTREQRWRRLGATALSVLPVGLGLIWSIFDEDRLCWHDRLSQTYLKSSF